MKKKIIISSSMKFKNQIKETFSKLETLGYKPLFPNLNFKPKGEKITQEEIRKLANDHYKKIEESDAIYFITKGSYMGTSCKLELGYAIASRKTIYFSEKTDDLSLDCYPKKIIPLNKLEELKKELI